MRVPVDRLKILRDRQKVQEAEVARPKRRFPPWLRAPLPRGQRYKEIKRNVRVHSLPRI